MPFDAKEAWLSGVRVRPSPEWSSTDSSRMLQEREGHTAVKLDENRILVVGGRDRSNKAEPFLNSSELYDLQTNTWKEWPELNVERSGHAAVFTNDKVYVFGGYNSKDYLVSIECLDLSCKYHKWEALKVKLTCKRSGCAAVVVGPLIYIIGGYETRSDWASVDVLDTTTHMIRLGPPMTTARSGCAAGVVNNTIYVVGGNDANEKAPKSMETLSAGKSQWKLCPQTMSTARSFLAVTVVEHCLIVVGGHDGESELSSAEVFDITRQVWWKLPDMEKHRYGCAAVTLGQSLVMILGGAQVESAIDADSMESLRLVVEKDAEAKQEIHELKERVDSLETIVHDISKRLSQTERRRRDEFQAIMSQLMQIQNSLAQHDKQNGGS